MLIVEYSKFKRYTISNFTLRVVIILIFFSSAATDERVSRENEENGKHW